MITLFIYLLVFIAGFFAGAIIYAQYHSAIITDLQKAKADAEYLYVNAAAEIAGLKDRLSGGNKAGKSSLPVPPPIINPPMP